MNAAARLEVLLQLMAQLRDPGRGCPWDQAQDFASIAPCTIEEAYEVADAIASGEPARIREELGDLLFQVVFHARLAEERGWFDFAAVAAGIHDKLVRRHPHVFGNAVGGDSASLAQQWEQHKRAERAASGQHGALGGVPLALPALTRAAKLGRRAAHAGFDWPDAAGVRAKIDEELGEADRALQAASPVAVAEELGDLLFTIVNWSRHLDVDPETALRAANRKFEQRFAGMEALAAQRGLSLASLDAGSWDELWRAAKATPAEFSSGSDSRD